MCIPENSNLGPLPSSVLISTQDGITKPSHKEESQARVCVSYDTITNEHGEK